MESQSGAEVRRLHIVYFLSRKGRIDHPHLIRVHHLSRNGVRLRDVKRWLGELRGKDIPESFSWSFKRKYKTGHVWQDLLDDDLITPISDNEYVLKGSEIISTIKAGNEEEQKTSNKEENQNHSSETSITVSTKSSSEIEEESLTFGSETSTLTDDSARADMAATTKPEKPITTKQSSTSYFTLLSKKSKKKSKKVSIDEKVTSEEEATANAVDSKIPSSEPQATKSKNHSNGASQMLRNLITCGDVDTIDTRKETNKQTKANLLNMCRASDLGNVHPAAICKRDGMSGGSQRIFGNPQWTQQQWGRKSFDGREQRAICCAAYKPVNGPNCSQCGKLFKPEKLHTHMKSCKGLKALSKCDANNAAEKASKGSMEFHNFSGHLLSH